MGKNSKYGYLKEIRKRNMGKKYNKERRSELR